MKILKSIGFDIPSLSEENYIRLDSQSSLSDVDIAIFCPDIKGAYYQFEFTKYEGIHQYDHASSVNILEHAKHWQKELANFVNNGGVLFIILNSKNDFYVNRGKNSFRGSVPKGVKINEKYLMSNYYFFAPNPNRFVNASGENVVPVSNLFLEFHKTFKEFIRFKTYITKSHNEEILFTTKKKDRVLGVCEKIGKGFLLHIPYVNFEDESLNEYNSESESIDWSEDGLKLGRVFINSIIEIDKSLRKNDNKTPTPEWMNNPEFDLLEAKNTRSLIHENTLEIKRLTYENETLNAVLQEQDSLKDLLFETGKPLENAVIKALKILGFSAENFSDGILELDQIILSPEEDRYIGECEGKDNKDIDISKFRQLLDNLNEDFEREEVAQKAYGLLFGNPQRLIPLQERTLDFTTKCKSGAEREKIGLIKTPDLFFAARTVLESKDHKYARKCRDEIKKQLGKVIVFPKYSK